MMRATSLQNIKPSYIREILSVANSADIISLAGGLPDQATFPLALMQDSLNNLTNLPSLFQYGNTAGYAPLLSYFKKHYQIPSSHDAIVCTGSQQGLDLIARAFVNPHDKVVMEAPSYLGAIQVFGLAQAKIESVSQQADGPNLQALEACFAQKDITLFYAVPDFHNPTGVCWSLAVRKKVGQLCQQYNVTLIEDAPYRELRFSDNDLPLASSFCPDHSLVLRSFSKIATPGIRLGLVSGKSDWIAALNTIKQAADLHSSMPMQAVLLDLLQHQEFPNHLEQLRNLYHERCQVLIHLLTHELPSYCKVNKVDGGMFVWLLLPSCDVDALAKSALTKGVAVVPSSVFYHQETKNESALRLNFTNANTEELTEAVKRLAKVIKDYC